MHISIIQAPVRGDDAQGVETDGNTDESKANGDPERYRKIIVFDAVCMLCCHFDAKDAIDVVAGRWMIEEYDDLDQIEEKTDEGQNDPWPDEARVFLQKIGSIGMWTFLATTSLAPWMRRDVMTRWAMQMTRKSATITFIPSSP